MTKRIAHIIGNGDQAVLYKDQGGIIITCNVPPFSVKNVFATFIIDFKMCKALDEGGVQINNPWIMGYRPKVFCEKVNPNFYRKHAQQIRGFYLDLPKYAGNYTNFNCGHTATHYTANKLKADEIHLYGFDSLFDGNMRSYTDLVLSSDRSANTNNKLISTWRPIWEGIFNEFPNTQFVLHHIHGQIKLTLPDNVRIEVHK